MTSAEDAVYSPNFMYAPACLEVNVSIPNNGCIKINATLATKPTSNAVLTVFVVTFMLNSSFFI